MNTTPPTAPRDRQSLDRFESALLTELRTQVATHPVHENATPPMHHRHRHRGRWAAGLAVAAATATAIVVASPGGPATSPAYAVDQTGDGEVVVTVHRLEDASGLEAALRDHGIDAEVSFDPADHLGEITIQDPDSGPLPAIPEEGGTVERDSGGSGPTLESSEDGPVTGVERVDPSADPAGCGTGSPATLTEDGDDWVLRIPADSPLQDREVQITTSAEGDLSVSYPGDQPNSQCGVMSSGG
jgi:hypothetical protein